jgi:hypothetical protein
MSFKHGRHGAAIFAGVDITSYLTSGDLSVEVDEAETTTWGNSWKRYIPGLASCTYSFEGYFDAGISPTFTSQVGDDPAGVLLVGPGGLAAGAPCRIVEVIETKYAETAPVGGVVGFSWECLADTIPGFGWVLAPLAAVDTDNPVTHIDGVASSSTGAIASLHVTSVSASDSIVVTIEDASVPTGGGANWATIGTFASKSAAGAERIVIAGTVRRYLRAVDDVTGTDVSITRAVAIART